MKPSLIFLASVLACGLVQAAPNPELEDALVRETRGGKESDMTKEDKPSDWLKAIVEFMTPQIAEKIKALFKIEIEGKIEPVIVRTKEFKKPGKPTSFDLAWGTNHFVKIKTKVKGDKKGEDKFFHVRIFKGTHPDDYPRLVGVDMKKMNGAVTRSSKDGIEPFGMFAEFQPDPMKLPVLKV